MKFPGTFLLPTWWPSSCSDACSWFHLRVFMWFRSRKLCRFRRITFASKTFKFACILCCLDLCSKVRLPCSAGAYTKFSWKQMKDLFPYCWLDSNQNDVLCLRNHLVDHSQHNPQELWWPFSNHFRCFKKVNVGFDFAVLWKPTWCPSCFRFLPID